MPDDYNIANENDETLGLPLNPTINLKNEKKNNGSVTSLQKLLDGSELMSIDLQTSHHLIQRSNNKQAKTNLKPDKTANRLKNDKVSFDIEDEEDEVSSSDS